MRDLAAKAHGARAENHELVHGVIVFAHLVFLLVDQLAQDAAVEMLAYELDVGAVACIHRDKANVIFVVGAGGVVGFGGASLFRLGLLLFGSLLGLALQGRESGGSVQVNDGIEIVVVLEEVVAPSTHDGTVRVKWVSGSGQYYRWVRNTGDVRVCGFGLKWMSVIGCGCKWSRVEKSGGGLCKG